MIIASAAICAAGPSSEIDEPAGALTLRQALALTLTRNPELAAVGYDIRIAEARILQAKLLPNPELDLESQDIVGSGEFSNARRSENTLQLGQLIELGGKRGARVREAGFGRDLAGFAYETKKREVFFKTAEHSIDVLSGQRRGSVNEELVQLAGSFIPAVEKRVEADKASDLKKTRFDVAIGSARIDLEQAKRDLLAARQHLAAQWGSTKPRFGSAGRRSGRDARCRILRYARAQIGSQPPPGAFRHGDRAPRSITRAGKSGGNPRCDAASRCPATQ